jgi:uncharacterized membrane protein
MGQHERVTTDRNIVATAACPRLAAIDLVRGLVMILMALDHTRDFFSDARFDPTDLTRTTGALFLTRWVTHFCAPVFVFLAGTGAYLYGTRCRSRTRLAWFLLSRGLWLVVLEFTLVYLGWAFRLDYQLLIGQVIWAIGASMVVLAGLVFLPAPVVLAIGVVLVAGHGLQGAVRPEQIEPWLGPWTILLRGGPVELPQDVRVYIAYPLLPWLGVMALGYGLGPVWRLDIARRRLWLVAIGLTLCGAFIALRAINGYGDPRPWSPQASFLFSVFSFLNCTKYPPSLLFVLMTLGPALLALAWFDRATPGPWSRPLVTFGRVPLFYYLLHVPLIHMVAVVVALACCGEAGFLFQHIFVTRPSEIPAGYGFGLPVVYLVWLGVVVALYPPCHWFAVLKQKRSDAWLSYL